MSDIAIKEAILEWRASRVARPLSFWSAEAADDDLLQIIQNPSRKHIVRRTLEVETTKTTSRPIYLVAIFAAGIVAFALGISLFFVGFFLPISSLDLLAPLLLAVGSVAVALSLLRGQDLDERAG